MNPRFWQRFLAIWMLAAMCLAPFQAASARPVAQDDGTQPAPAKSAAEAGTQPDRPAKVEPAAPAAPAFPDAASYEDAIAKLDPALRAAAEAFSPEAAAEPIAVQVYGAPGLDLSKFFVDGKVLVRPALTKGDTPMGTYLGFVTPTNLMKLAFTGGVNVIAKIHFERNAFPEDYPIDFEKSIPERTPEDWAYLRSQAEKLSEQAKAWPEGRVYGDGLPYPAAEDWFEINAAGPHKAEAAWDRGFQGEGVTVAVLDDGIDAAHPDLMGTQKIYSSTKATAYNGWPMVFSPFSAMLYAYDEALGTTYLSDGYLALHYVDTSFTPALSNCGAGVRCFDFTPLIDVGTPGLTHSYVISASQSLSGAPHVGTHPDFDLRDWVWGERPAVLATDPNTAGVYDTVYVDLNMNFDFRDDKPLTKADTSSAGALEATKNNMIAYLDVTGDGYADISGGMVYFIANGVNPIPGTDYIWGATCAGGFMCPGNGDLVAFSGSTFDRAYSHGTQCASNVVGQGVVHNASLGLSNEFLPAFRDLPPGPGKPSAAVYGMAPKAGIVNVSDIYYNHVPSTIDGYLFAAVGYDAVDQTGFNLLTGNPMDTDTDTIVANSNSYGASDEDWDGYDLRGQVVSQLQRWYAPFAQYLFSTGNGAPGYGTSAPPSPDTAIAVGASTEYGSTGWDTITDTTQISFNDYVAFSNSGPGARAGAGVDVLAGGAYAAGDEELNYYSVSTWGVYDGNYAWVSWGGTSRSAPTALGILALIVQAFKETHGRWPTYQESKALLMSSATNLDADTFKQGAGSVNADRGTLVASGEYGVRTEGDSFDWNPGDFRGDLYPGFAQVVYPGDTFTKTFTVNNDSAAPLTASVSDGALTLIDSVELQLDVTPAMKAAESAFGAANRDNFYKAFQYFIPITATASADPAWQNVTIPPDTEFMVVRQMFPFDQFDVNGDYTWDARFYLMVYNWKDINGDGDVWEDKNANGVVNFINAPCCSLIDGGAELEWGDARTELDQWEYVRFGYNRPVANTNELTVSHPLQRMNDGLFIGLRHLYNAQSANITTNLSYRLEFYKKADVSWLSADTASLVVPAGGSASFVGTVNVPLDMPAGDYAAAFYLGDPGSGTYPAHTSVIPVTANVAAQFDGDVTFGSYDTYQHDYGSPYNNGVVRGYQEWSWRPESGDWRMFYMDNQPATAEVATATTVIAQTTWADKAPHTDLDSVVLGPSGSDLAGECWFCFSEPGYFGPYQLRPVATSPNTNVNAGIWLFDTSSGTNEDWVGFPEQSGLHRFLQHNVMFEGDQFDVVFTQTVGAMTNTPTGFAIETWNMAGEVGELTVESTIDLPGITTDAYMGLQRTIALNNEPIDFTGAGSLEFVGDPFTVTDGVSLEVYTSSGISDIDLFLFYWNGSAWVQRAASAGGDSNEYIFLTEPADGSYLVAIDNYSGPAGTFNLTINIAERNPGLIVTGHPTGALPANTPVTLNIAFDLPGLEDGVTYQGVVGLGVPGSRVLTTVPVAITYHSPTAGVAKHVDQATAFPGDPLEYTIDLFNVNDLNAYFEFVDPLPASVEYVTATMTINSPPPAVCSISEAFEGAWPVPGWTVKVNSGAGWNTNTYWGRANNTGGTGQSAGADADSFGTGMNTELWSPSIDLRNATTAQVSYNSNFQDLASSGDAYLDISTNGGGAWTNVFSISVDEPTTGIARNFDLSAYTGNVVILRWHFVTPGWDWWWYIDNVSVTSNDAGCVPSTGDYGKLTYDALSHSLVYTGPLPLSNAAMTASWAEGFEAGGSIPAGWEVVQDNPNQTWGIGNFDPFDGAYYADIQYDDLLVEQDEWLVSPPVNAYGKTLSFQSFSSIYWCRDTFDNCDLEAWVIVGDGVNDGDDIFLGLADPAWPANWTWAESSFDLMAAGVPDEDVRLAFRYAGLDGAEAAVDHVQLLESGYTPAATIHAQVLITDTIAAGDYITNTAALHADHILPQETQHEMAEASAVTHIGIEDFRSSFKSAPALVQAGDNIRYDIHVVNSGDALAFVNLMDEMPVGTTFSSIVSYPPANFDFNPALNAVVWSGNVTPGDHLVFTFYAKASANLPVGTVISNTAELEWNGQTMDMTAESEVVPGAMLQVAHLAPFAAAADVTVKVDGATALTGFSFAEGTAYLPIHFGSHKIEVFPAGSSTAAIVANVTLDPGEEYTALAVGGANGWPLELELLTDDNTAPTAGMFKLRLGHFAPFAAGAGTLADVRLQDGTVILDDVPYGANSPYLELPAGMYDLKITSPDGSSTLIDPLPVTFAAGDILSAFAVGDGANQALGVFALPSDDPGFLLPLALYRTVLPMIYTVPAP